MQKCKGPFGLNKEYNEYHRYTKSKTGYKDVCKIYRNNKAKEHNSKPEIKEKNSIYQKVIR